MTLDEIDRIGHFGIGVVAVDVLLFKLTQVLSLAHVAIGHPQRVEGRARLVCMLNLELFLGGNYA